MSSQNPELVQYPRPPKKRRRWPWIVVGICVVVVVFIIVLGAILGSGDQKESAPAVASTSPPPRPQTTHTSMAATSTASDAPTSTTAATVVAGLTGLGATPDQWDAAHQENTFFNNGQVYGDDPSLPDYLANHGAVYFAVQFIGNNVYDYSLNMHDLDKSAAIARAQQELPDDAVQTWEIPISGCVRVAFTSQKLKEALGSPTANVELVDIKSDGSSSPSPTEFNQEQFSSGGLASATPDPDFGC